MIRANIKNRSFDRMGEQFAPLIDPNHFLGRSAFDIHYPKTETGPAASLIQKGDLYVLEIPLPGFKKENIRVEVKDELLFVNGTSSSETNTSNPEFVQSTFEENSFERVFKLSPVIAKEGIAAKLQADVLRITFTDVPTEEERSQRLVTVE